jgi:hypothetical protein
MDGEVEDPELTLNLYRRLLAFRKDSMALRRGSSSPIPVPASRHSRIGANRIDDPCRAFVVESLG